MFCEEALPGLRSRLVGRARRLGADAASAQDLAQETLQEAWRLRDRVYDPAGMDRWVDAIFTNVYRRWAGRVGGEQAARSDAPSESFDVPADYDLEVELERGELADLLDRALGLLPADTREVLIGRFVRETPLGELASQLGLQPGALRMRLQRGKLALRNILTTTYADDAVAWGLLAESEAGWQETRIWCPDCGKVRLQARFSGPQRSVEFVCPHDPYRYRIVDGDTTAYGVTGFRATFKKLGMKAYDFWLDHLRGDGHPGTLTWETDGFVQVQCSRCGETGHTYPSCQALFTPDGRRFWRDHPRMQIVGCHEVDAGGVPAVLTSYQSLSSRARLDVLLARDSFRILRSEQS